MLAIVRTSSSAPGCQSWPQDKVVYRVRVQFSVVFQQNATAIVNLPSRSAKCVA